MRVNHCLRAERREAARSMALSIAWLIDGMNGSLPRVDPGVHQQRERLVNMRTPLNSAVGIT